MTPNVQIDGYDGLDEEALLDDTDPTATQITFDVKSEVMPYKSDQEGKIIRENYVWIKKVINLGNSIVERRIKDKVEFNTETNKWKVNRLAPVSDIKTYPEQWNAFCRNANQGDIGTPLSLIFKNDPTLVEMYKAKYITSLEQLAACSDADLQMLGMGAREHKAKARQYLEKIKELAPSIATSNALEEKDRKIASLESRISDLSDKLTQLLSAALEEKKPRKTKTNRGPKAEADAQVGA